MFAAGYGASIYSWPRIKLWVNGAQAEIAGLEAKATALKAVAVSMWAQSQSLLPPLPDDRVGILPRYSPGQ